MCRSNIFVVNFSSVDLSGADLTHIDGDTVDFTDRTERFRKHQAGSLAFLPDIFTSSAS